MSCEKLAIWLILRIERQRVQIHLKIGLEGVGGNHRLPLRVSSRPPLLGLPEAQEDPGQVPGPVGTAAAGSEGVLEAAMEALDHSVCQWVVGGGRRMADVEEAAQLIPGARSKLDSSVSG